MTLRRIFIPWLWLASYLLLTAVPALQAQAPVYRCAELLVQFKSDQRSKALTDFERRAGIRIKGTLAKGRIVHLALPPGLTVEQAAARYAQDPGVAFAEPNYLYKPQSMPDDPQFIQQWGLENTGQQVNGYVGTPGADVQAVRAWTVTKGRPEVVVAVLDTGVNQGHPDLTVNHWTNLNEIPENGIDDDGNGFVDDIHGWDFVDDDNQPQDASGHGTHVAGIIAAQGNNGIGVSGVAWRAAVMPLRFIDAFDSGATSDAIKAIAYAVAQGAKVINCSWGGRGYSAALKYAMQNTPALFICAAGNEAADNDDNGFYPAGFPLANIVSVAASDQQDRLAWFSNFGRQKVHLAAPGIRIYNLASQRQTLWQEDFQSADLHAWTLGGDPIDWDLVVPSYIGSSTCLAGSPSGDYPADSNTWAISPVLDLSASAANMLEFQLAGSSEPSADVLHVEASTDLASWRSRPLLLGSTLHSGGISGTIPYWMPVKADLGPWDGASRLYVRFRFHSDSTGSAAGFFIDNIRLTAAATGEAYQFMQGTSMATAFVSGVAALACAQDPELSVAELKTCILDSVDLDPALKDLTVSGGRLNAYNALTLLRELSLSATPEAADRIHLTWSAQTALDSQVIVERRHEDDNEFQIVADVNALQNSYVDSALSAGTTYYYRVLAATADGRNGYSPQTEATTPDRSAGGAGGSGGGCFVGSVWQ